MKPDYIWVDGDTVPYARATVHLLNPTLHYGNGVFEDLMCYATDEGPAVFRMQAHLDRFFRSLRVLGLERIPFDEQDLGDAVRDLIRVNHLDECRVRVFLHWDGSLESDVLTSRPVIAAAAWAGSPAHKDGLFEEGARVTISSIGAGPFVPGWTAAAYWADARFPKIFARGMGFDHTVLVDSQGFVAGETAQSLFVVRGGALVAGPIGPLRETVARESVLTLAQDLGISTSKAPLARETLLAADEVFLCGTVSEIVPIRQMDFHTIGDGRCGRVTYAIQKAFLNTVRGRGNRSREWLTLLKTTSPVHHGD